MLRRFVPLALGLAAFAALGCSGPTSGAPESVGEATDPIVNGVFDSDAADDGIVALLWGNDQFFTECTGTVIKADATNLYILTAAHCCPTSMPPQVALQGSDFAHPTAQFNVTKYARHPLYVVGQDAAQPFDFCMVTASLGGHAAPPVIPAMTKATDKVFTTTPITAVGYGQTVAGPEGSDDNSFRNKITNQRVKSFYPSPTTTRYQALYDETAGGTCFGDSGGPDLAIDGTGHLAVFGVHSFVSGNCNMESGSGIVSTIYDEFIATYLAGQPTTFDCNECTTAVQDGACGSQTQACAMSSECVALANCEALCKTADCVQACETQHPSGVSAYDGYHGCVCSGTCSSVCAATFCADIGPSSSSSSSTTTSASASSSTGAGDTGGSNGAGGSNGSGGDVSSDSGCDLGGRAASSSFAGSALLALSILAFGKRRLRRA